MLVTAALVIGSIILLGLAGAAFGKYLTKFIIDSLMNPVEIGKVYPVWESSLKMVSTLLFLSIGVITVYLYILKPDT
ncbi:MAG: hypothetical protein ABEI78_00910, partial [Candidatus Nanohaloarchaea archaeon]